MILLLLLFSYQIYPGPFLNVRLRILYLETQDFCFVDHKHCKIQANGYGFINIHKSNKQNKESTRRNGYPRANSTYHSWDFNFPFIEWKRNEMGAYTQKNNSTDHGIIDQQRQIEKLVAVVEKYHRTQVVEEPMREECTLDLVLQITQI